MITEHEPITIIQIGTPLHSQKALLITVRLAEARYMSEQDECSVRDFKNMTPAA